MISKRRPESMQNKIGNMVARVRLFFFYWSFSYPIKFFKLFINMFFINLFKSIFLFFQLKLRVPTCSKYLYNLLKYHFLYYFPPVSQFSFS